MLTKNNYIKYDMALQEYYITKDAVTNYTTYTDDKLGSIFGDVSKSFKIISHMVYKLIYGWRKGIGRQDHIKYMRKKIYNNANGEVTALMFAMIEAVKGAVESGMDLNAYIDDPKDNLPYTVKEELSIAELLDSSKKPTNTEDIDYTLEEINAT